MQMSIFLNRLLIQSVHPSPSSAFLVPPLRHSLQPFTIPLRCPKPYHCPRRAISVSTVNVRASAKSSTSAVETEIQPPPPSSDIHPTLVIVESPAKAVTIQSILPSSQYRVRSCVGHIREIPSSAKRIPARFKQLPWARLGVDVTSDFRPIYVVISGKQSVITDLRSELREARRLVLATDDDREGEAISWHLLQVLNPKIPVFRAVFHEITPTAIDAAFANFRDLNMGLVDAQETRRVLDRLAGYTMSPLLWKKVAKGLSAGRVQSVAMSVVVRRERERLLFVPAHFSGCSATFATSKSSFDASLSLVDSVRLVRGSDFSDTSGKLLESIKETSVRIFDHDSMQSLRRNFHTIGEALVTSVDCRRTTRNPPLPLITSTLQQECGNRLGMGAGKTMSVAQKLYETGLITYMRTDNPVLGDAAVSACRTSIEELYGKDALWDGKSPRRTGGKPKAAQAAHEAIRPAGTRFTHPDELTNASDEERAVYTIVYRRALASQMASAKLDQTTIKLSITSEHDGVDSNAEFKATGSVIVKPGFLLVYQDDENTDSSTFLPALSEGDVVGLKDASVLDHVTKPPPRFNDASLVKVLEEKGVGRPSTYAGIIEKLITRGYIYRGRNLPADKKIPPKAVVPSLTAFAVEHLLSTHFPSFVDAEFTARMEQALDEIADGSGNRESYLREYYSGEDGLAESVERKQNDIDARSFRHVLLPNMRPEMQVGVLRAINEESSGLPRKSKKRTTSKKVVTPKRKVTKEVKGSGGDGELNWSSIRVLVSSYGPYVEQDGEVIASLPKTTLADDLTSDRLQNVLHLAQDPVIGTDPETNQAILLRTSRFGPYIQLGRDEDMAEGTKPKRCSLFPGMDVSDVTLDVALKLLSLPRVLGKHADTDEEIRAALGPYGPYVAHGTTYVSLRKDEHDVLDIGFGEAMELLNGAEERKVKRLEKQEERKAKKAAAEKEKATKIAGKRGKSSIEKSTDNDSKAKKNAKKVTKTTSSSVTSTSSSSTTSKARQKTTTSTRSKSAV